MNRLGHYSLLFGVLAISGCRTRAENIDPQFGSDASLDTRIDVGDGGIACDSDNVCNDGVFCNGQERCVAGACVRETRVCDDQIACTRDTCSEEQSRCVFSALDGDGDGYGAATCLDNTGAPLGIDCDDGDANRYPGNLEVCDIEGHDEDCDAATIGSTDADEDRAIDIRCCNVQADGSNRCGTDCDDARASVRPGATEVCNDIDDDCDGTRDEDLNAVTLYRDRDGDGRGVLADTRTACGQVAGYSLVSGDCNDDDIAINDIQPEICDNRDNNCNSLVDQNDNPPAQAVTWYLDSDGDGFGAAGEGRTSESCTDPSTPTRRFSLLSTDCNDSDASIRPTASERCNAIDDNCNGRADFQLADGNGEDDDGDGVADTACTAANGTDGTDCDDRDPTTAPGFAERCDGRDNNCNGRADENAQTRAWFPDRDGDSYGDALGEVQVSCAGPSGYVSRAGDCNDSPGAGAMVNPGRSEVCNNADDNCDGAIDNGAPAAMCDIANATPLCVRGACDYSACNNGAADCNGLRSDGCEVLLAADRDNCGACGRSCAGLLNTESTACSGGQCRIESCVTGYRDCDNRAASGCEVDTVNDVRNCGDCARPCYSDANTFGFCANAGCGAVCRAGFENCDNNMANGCEQSLRTQAHCGLCGNRCPMAGEANLTLPSLCGQRGGFFDCTLQPNSCAVGFLDCNQSAQDGCEVNITTTQNCGGCFRNCPATAPNASAVACVAGNCSPQCQAAFLNCDNDSFNGCETNRNTSKQNCGTCGTVCAVADVCSAGYCGSAMQGGSSPVAVGSHHACTLYNGFVHCWGQNDHQEVCAVCGNNGTVPGARVITSVANVTAVYSGDDFTCALGGGGAFVSCWGRNERGQLGRSGGAGPFGPDNVSGLPAFGINRIAVGARHACAVVNGGVSDEVYCWGENTDGQSGPNAGLATSTATLVPLPQFRPTQYSIAGLVAGERFTCAAGDGVNDEAIVVCWGSIGTFTGPTPTQLVFSASAGCAANPATLGGMGIQPFNIAAGRAHLCFQVGMTNGYAICYGDNSFGQLGTGNTAPYSCPVVASVFQQAGMQLAGLSMGDGFTCASLYLNTVSDTRCVGRNDFAQLGRAGATSAFEVSPAQVDEDASIPGTNVRGAGGWNSGAGAVQCASIVDGFNSAPGCWGNNSWGALGTRLPTNPSSNEALAPTVVVLSAM